MEGLSLVGAEAGEQGFFADGRGLIGPVEQFPAAWGEAEDMAAAITLAPRPGEESSLLELVDEVTDDVRIEAV